MSKKNSIPAKDIDASQDAGDPKSKDKNKKNTSLRLDKQTLKALKIRAIEKETSIQKLIEQLIIDYLKK